jgi:hypothetical protein
MGKAYVLTAVSPARVRTIAAEFARRVKQYPFRRKASLSDAYQRPNFEGWRVIIDVCGPVSPEIDSLHAAIQESEEY